MAPPCRWCGQRDPHPGVANCPEFVRYLQLIHLDEPEERSEPDPDENPMEDR